MEEQVCNNNMQKSKTHQLFVVRISRADAWPDACSWRRMSAAAMWTHAAVLWVQPWTHLATKRCEHKTDNTNK